MTDESDFEAIPQEKLHSLGELAARARNLNDSIEKLTEQLKELTAAYQLVTEKEMPDIMMELGLEQLKLTTGEKLTMKKFYSASIKPEFQDKAFEWLRKNGHDSLIKNKVEGSFGKGDDERVQKVMELLEANVPGCFSCKTSVHAMTLKSFVKEQMESGKDIPADVFSIYVGNKITIK